MRTAIALFALVGSLLIGGLTLTPSALADTLGSKAPETATAYIISPC
jgi:ABC-type Mn2+/Zn2+ transport system permease subunit